MKTTKRRYARKAVIALGILALAGWLAPTFFNAERYRRRISAGLAQALGRPVTFGSISFHLLPRPGFSVQDVVIGEDPSFGLEPFAHVEQADCDLEWRSVVGSRLVCSRVMLDQAHLNLVRMPSGQWNIESLLDRGSAALTAAGSTGNRRGLRALEIEADDARLDFVLGDVKIPLAVTNLSAQLNLEANGGAVGFRLAGSPFRSDLPLPTPGEVDLTGEWRPGAAPMDRLKASFHTHNALLYDWIPLITGRNQNVYGLFDVTMQVSGSREMIQFEGQSRLSELHRADQLPPSADLPLDVHFRGRFDRQQGRLLVEAADARFADSQIQLSGAVDNIPSAPEFDLVVALERSRLEDLGALQERLVGIESRWKVRGRIDGLMTLRGLWADRRYGGFLSARGVSLETPAESFPVTDVGIRIDGRGARWGPARIDVAPNIGVLVEGKLEHAKGSAPVYALTFSSRNVPLGGIVRAARERGAASLEHVEAMGMADATAKLTGSAWPFSKPALDAQADLSNVSLRLPGLTLPLRLRLAHLTLSNDQFVATPLVASIGSTVFSGRLDHAGRRDSHWKFDLETKQLDAGQASLWFDVLGRKTPSSFFWRLPGIQSLVARREAATDLFARFNAEGRLRVRTLTYRALTLHEVDAQALIGHRTIRISPLTFHAGGGKGTADIQIDLDRAPALLTAKVALANATIQALRPVLPPQLSQARGVYSLSVDVESRGLERGDVADNLSGTGTVTLKDLWLGNFDPLEDIAKEAGLRAAILPRGARGVAKAELGFKIAHEQVVLSPSRLDLGGAELNFSGAYDLRNGLDLNIRADLNHLRRPWASAGLEGDSAGRQLTFHLSGPFNRLSISRGLHLTEAHPQ
jgi:AsmA-like protein